jgi:hypothetical protein
MEKKLYYVLMADVIDSRKLDQQNLMTQFKNIVMLLNSQHHPNILSPMTITLGDEFQGVVNDLQSAINIIIALEEMILLQELRFKLRYTLIQGQIDTEINSKIAYEMLGEGLTTARQCLQNLKNDKRRFYVGLKDKKLADAVNNTFFAFQGIVDGWTRLNDVYIASKFINDIDYKQIAIEINKEKSVIWKRKKSLKIDDYLALRNVLKYLGEIAK